MKIIVEEKEFKFSAEWPDTDDDSLRPDVETAVDRALYLLTKVFNGYKVQEEARKWDY